MEHITPDYRKSQLLLIHFLTKAQPKAILLSWIQTFTKMYSETLFFLFNKEGNPSFIALQTIHFKQLNMSQNSLKTTENKYNRFMNNC